MLFILIFSKFTIFLTCIVSANQNHSVSKGTSTNHKKEISKRCQNFKDDFTDLKNITVVKEEFCKNKTCIAKCCLENHVFYEGECKPISFIKTIINHSFNYSDFDIYEPNIRLKKRKSKKNLMTDYEFVRNLKVLQCGTEPIKVSEDFNYILLENASIVAEKKNSDQYTTYWKMEDFCLEYQIRNESNVGPRTDFIFVTYPGYETVESDPDTTRATDANNHSRSSKTSIKKTNKKNKIICENPKDDFTDLKNINIDKEEFCKNKTCIAKCCMGDYVINKGTCQPISSVRQYTNHSFDYSDFDIFETNIRQIKIKSKKSLKKDYAFVRNRKVLKCGTRPIIKAGDIKYLLLENTTMVAEKINSFNQYPAYWKMEDFCLEYQLRNTENKGKQVFLIFLRYPRNETVRSESDAPFSIPRATALLLSCFFLVLVLIVYWLIRKPRTVFDMVLMVYVSTLTITFLIKAIVTIQVDQQQIDVKICQHLTVVLYFTILAGFFWLNVMSYDIWWGHKSITNRQPGNKRGKRIKLRWYSLYAFGIPSLMTIFAVVVEYVDFSKSGIKSFGFKHCLYNPEHFKIVVYIHIPIGILIASNCVFFLLTVRNIWKVKSELAEFDKKDEVTRNKNQNRFKLFITLFLVMGISWILELLSLTGWMETVATLYNSSIGVAIFFIFVFKRDIFVALCERFNINNSFVDRMRRKLSTATAGSSVYSKRTTNTAEQ